MTAQFDFRDLELFVAVAEVGSIAKAAERAHTVASAVSKRLSELEIHFGTPLLVRGAKGVELTSAGHALLIKARDIDKFEITDVVEAQTTFLAGDVFKQAAVGGKACCG